MRMPMLMLLFAAGACLPPAAVAADASYSQIARGRYLVKAGDCAACHTDQEGKPFAGGRAVPTPFGTIYSSNITPDKETGIGNWSEADFYKAMHDGIGRDGDHLYPAFPYPWFTRMSRDDVASVKAYLDTLPPVRQDNKPPDLPWPMSWRGSVAVWNQLFFHEGAFKSRADKSAAWNRGAYLVEGPGHCGACHTAKNVLGGTERAQPLEGGNAGEHWYAPSLAGDLRTGLGKWSAQEIATYLKTGSTRGTAAAGPMADVVKDSTQYLSDADLLAIAAYLKDMPAPENRNESKLAKADNQAMSRGSGLYIDNCAGCHMENGGGQQNTFPSLRNSAAVQAQNPDTLIHIVLAGGRRPATGAKPSALAMPSFHGKLSDQEVADLITFIRNAWGNRAPATGAGNVSDVRKSLVRSSGG